LILIGIGSNLSGGGYKTSVDVCEAALSALADKGITVLRHSQWFESEPVPVSEQPWFINGVASVETPLSAVDLLSCLHEIEDSFGRIRRQRNEARILDLDLLAFGSDIIEIPNGPIVPHPRLHERAFVLLPLQEIAQDWRHPSTGRSIAALVGELSSGQNIRPLKPAGG
jgi:2-amino-4-hydroxy-6-hydroxymethyldihydropteridine diphosphokinase